MDLTTYAEIDDNDVFTSEQQGIVLEDSNYNEISNNRVKNNSKIGIWCLNSNNNNFSENTVKENIDHGIMLIDCDENNLISNTINNNTKDGIYLLSDTHCYNNTIIDNDIYNNSLNGITIESFTIELLSTCLDNSIEDNDISNNLNYGVAFFNATLNSATNNTIFNNKIGIKLNSSNLNTFKDNLIYDNSEFGIHIGDPYFAQESNLFYLNEFNNPIGLNAEDDGLNNDWDNGFIGNWWHDYIGLDTNDDGIGDTDYIISGSAGSRDTKPIYWDAPYIIINSPELDEVYGISAPNYDISVLGDVDKTWYNLDDGTTVTDNITIDLLSDQLSQIEWNDMDDGIITLTFYANDSVGNVGFEEVEIEKDSISPDITVIQPEKGDKFKNQAPNYEITVDDPNLETIWYSISDEFEIFRYRIITNLIGSINQTIWNSLSYGEITLLISVNDTLGNTDFIEITIIKARENSPGLTLILILSITIPVVAGAVTVILMIYLRKKRIPLTPFT